MTGSTLIILLASLWFIIFGLLITYNKKVREILVTGSRVTNKEAYVKFNGIFNIILGILGLVLGVLDYFIKGYTLVFVVIFIVMMFSASLLQSLSAKKYK